MLKNKKEELKKVPQDELEVQPLYPVVTIVLHFGLEHWTQPKNLKEVVSIPTVLEPYVNDYRIHVFEIAWLSDEQVAMFKSDFRIVAEFFTQARKNKKYKPSQQEIKHVDAVLKLLSVVGGIDQINETITEAKEKEGKDMSYQTAFDRFKKLWKDDGREQGLATALLTSVENLQKNAKMSLPEALNALGKTMEEYEIAKKLLENED